MYDMTIAASEYKGGPVVEKVFENFPENLHEAVAEFGAEAVYNGWLRSFVIAEQNKIRASAKSPTNGTRTRQGSPVAQAEKARREAAMKAASQAVADAELAAAQA